MKSDGAAQPVLRVEDLQVTYETRRGDVRAVRDVSFEVFQGESFGLVGESGCGKSTAAFALMGYLSRNARIEGGRVLFQGQNVLERTERELQSIRGNSLAMIYQDPMSTLNPSFRIGDQLREVLATHTRTSDEETYTRCIEMLDKVHIPDPARVMERYPHQLSGGQLQRVVIGMGLLCNPAVLIMDEPTTGLDVTVEASVLDTIRDLRQKFDSGIVYISHNLSVIARVCDRVGVMYAGELVEKATVHDIFLNPLHPYARGLIGCVPGFTADKHSAMLCSIPGRVPSAHEMPPGCLFEPRCPYATDACKEEHPSLREVDGGRTVRCLRWETVADGQICGTGDGPKAFTCAVPDYETSVLEVSGLRSYYRDKPSWIGSLLGKEEKCVKAVDGVSLNLKSHAVLGIVGESGCGKSTLAKTIVGLVSPTDGKIEFLGEDIARALEKRPREILEELRMVFQNPNSTLNPMQTVDEILGRPLKLSRVVPRSEIKEEIRRWLAAVNLDESYMDRKPRQMSGGEKQRVAIARAFASRPELVICDEPVSSLDVSVKCSVLKTLLTIQSAHGTSLAYISHDLSVVHFLCDYILVMYLGRICEAGTCREIFRPPYHPYTEALLSAVPVPDPTIHRKRIRLEGSVPSALNPPRGCRFHTRCPRKIGMVCETEQPPVRETKSGHAIACHIPLADLEAIEPVIMGRGEAPAESQSASV